MTTTNTIPNFDGWSATQIQGWIDTNPANTTGIEQAQVALAKVTQGDVNGAAGGPTAQTSGITLPPPSTNIDLKGAGEIMAKFEELLILFQLMAAENKKFSRQDANALLEKASAELMKAAEKKQEGADKLLTMAIVSLVVTVVGAALSIILAPISAVTGGAQQAAQEGAKKAVETTVKQIKKTVLTTIKNAVKKFIKKTLEAIKKAVQKATTQGIRQTVQKVTVSLVKKTLVVASKPETVMGIFSAVSQSMNALGQSQSLTAQADGDRHQAFATEAQAEQRKAEEFVGDFREAMKKMNDLLRTLYDAKLKSEEAAAKA